MELRIAGATRHDDHDALLDMARVLVTGLRFTGLPRAGQAKPFIRGPP